MSGLENMQTRLNMLGGVVAEDRFIKQKAKSLNKALLYSYQAMTVVTSTGKEFRALLNTDKLSGDYDSKVLSIPYADINLNDSKFGTKTSAGIQKTELKNGDVFTWKEQDSKWIIFLEHKEEDAYFRADCRRCDQRLYFDDKEYWVYARGPAETTIQWRQTSNNLMLNDLNYSLVVYITKDDYTLEALHRHAKVLVEEAEGGEKLPWKIVAVNRYFGDGIIEVCLDEDFNNEFEDTTVKLKKEETADDSTAAHVSGPTEVYAYSKQTYTIKNTSGGTWYVYLNGSTTGTSLGTDDSVTVDINMKSGYFTIVYKVSDTLEYSQKVTVKSL